MFMALIALLWGARGATLVAFAATLLALFHTSAWSRTVCRHRGAAWAIRELEVQGYTAAMALTGLLVAGLEAGATECDADGARLAHALRGGDRRASADRLRMGSGRAVASSSPATRARCSACRRNRSALLPTGSRTSRPTSATRWRPPLRCARTAARSRRSRYRMTLPDGEVATSTTKRRRSATMTARCIASPASYGGAA